MMDENRYKIEVRAKARIQFFPLGNYYYVIYPEIREEYVYSKCIKYTSWGPARLPTLETAQSFAKENNEEFD